jgi:L-threonylcarbamoyladenylate synthase
MIVEATPENLQRAAAILHGGGIVAFPTETVYGLGANALDSDAVAKIFAAKERPAYNPLIVHVASIEAAQQVLSAWTETAQRLAEAFWPGPLTLVLPKANSVPDIVTAGLPTVGVRIPAHPIAHALLETAQLPLAAPSANRFTQISPTDATHVQKSLGERADLILSGGATSVGIESTVLSLAESTPVLLRPGGITREQIETIIGSIEVAQKPADQKAPLPSPGMLDRHYAPRAETRRFEISEKSQALALAQNTLRAGKTIGALLQSTLDAPIQHRIEMSHQPAAYAQQLYAALHQLEDANCDLILVEMPPDTAEWHSIRDRLWRATETVSGK